MIDQLTGRVDFLFSNGHVGARYEAFIGQRASGPAMSVIAITAFAMYVHQLKAKYSANTLEKYKTAKQMLVRNFWIFFVIFFIVWASLAGTSIKNADM